MPEYGKVRQCCQLLKTKSSQNNYVGELARKDNDNWQILQISINVGKISIIHGRSRKINVCTNSVTLNSGMSRYSFNHTFNSTDFREKIEATNFDYREYRLIGAIG